MPYKRSTFRKIMNRLPFIDKKVSEICFNRASERITNEESSNPVESLSIIIYGDSEKEENVEGLEAAITGIEAEVIYAGITEGKNFAGVINDKVRQARGNYILIASSNTCFYKNSIKNMLPQISGNKKAGIIAPGMYWGKNCNYNKISLDKKVISEGVELEPVKRFRYTAYLPVFSRNGETASIDKKVRRMLIPGLNCVLMSKKVFVEIGGICELYCYVPVEGMKLYNDTVSLLPFADLCVSAEYAGYKNYFCGNSFISVRNAHNDKYDKVLSKYNASVFRCRWEMLLKRYNLNISGRKNVESFLDPKQIDILGSMPDNETKKFWGDLYYAEGLKEGFEKLGYKAEIVCYENWHNDSNAMYKIVLRGKYGFFPPADKCGVRYIMWNISHSSEVEAREYNLFDYIFFAGKGVYDRMKNVIKPGSDLLLQCADANRIKFNETDQKRFELLFIGNSRRIYRKILKDLLPTKYRLSVFGRQWEEYPVHEYVESEFIPNEQIAQAYHDACIVLNDHWDDMREDGIISNRVFDVLASEGFLISDYLPEIGETFGDLVVTYTDREDLRKKIEYYMNNPEERLKRARKGREIVLKEHTFYNRAESIAKVLDIGSY